MFGTYRTFLALLVVALHIGGVPNIGAYAVFGFYCLSGYLMTLIMHSNYGYSPAGIAKYAANRLLRIFPIYWFSILLSAVLIWQLGGSFTVVYHETMYFPDEVADWARNVLLFFPFREAPRLTPPAWALTVELFFYLLIALGISKNRVGTLIWLALSISYHVYALLAQWGWSERYFTIAAASLPFSAGAAIYHYKDRMVEVVQNVSGRFYLHAPLIGAGAILLNWALGRVVAQSTGLFFYSNFVLCALMVVILSSRQHLPFISQKLDKWMGDFSYPIYLLHYQAGLIAVILLAAAGLDIKRPDGILFFASLPVLFFCAWLTIVVFERPIDLLRAAIRQRAEIIKNANRIT